MHLVDEGEGPPVLLLHGNPTWSFLWRKVIPLVVEAGLRTVAPDLIGFGLSDKPRDPSFHTLENHIRSMDTLVRKLDLDNLIILNPMRGTSSRKRSRRSWRKPSSLFTAVLADFKEILQKFFRPRQVAVVGASRYSRAVGYRVVESLMKDRFQGAIYPVNPKAWQIHGIPSYPSVKAMPHLWRRKG